MPDYKVRTEISGLPAADADKLIGNGAEREASGVRPAATCWIDGRSVSRAYDIAPTGRSQTFSHAIG